MTGQASPNALTRHHQSADESAAHILVVEDEPIIAAMLACVLDDAGYAVTLAEHGAAALASLQTCTPSLILTDFMMPVMNGLDLAQAVHADERLRNIPIILVSGVKANVAREHPGLFRYVLDKPYRPDHLLAAIEEALPDAGAKITAASS